MNQETRRMPIFGPRACVDALTAPAHALAEGVLHGLSVLRRKLEKRSAERKRDRAIAITVKELSQLEDRVLKDIGISRGNIHVVAIAVVDNPNVNLRQLVGR